eukprot:361250-Chlamydomonas_euryale.AAC.6
MSFIDQQRRIRAGVMIQAQKGPRCHYRSLCTIYSAGVLSWPAAARATILQGPVHLGQGRLASRHMASQPPSPLPPLLSQGMDTHPPTSSGGTGCRAAARCRGRAPALIAAAPHGSAGARTRQRSAPGCTVFKPLEGGGGGFRAGVALLLAGGDANGPRPPQSALHPREHPRPAPWMLGPRHIVLSLPPPRRPCGRPGG